MAYRYAVGSVAGQRIVGSQKYLATGTNRAVLFCVERSEMVLLHGFIKKTQQTPRHDIDLALKRKRGGGS